MAPAEWGEYGEGVSANNLGSEYISDGAGLTFIQDWGATAEDRNAWFPQFVIMKSRDNVEEYVRVLSSAAVEFENILELG